MAKRKNIKNLKRFLFVINPIAGTVDKSNLSALLERYTTNYKWKSKVYRTSGQEDRKNIKAIIENFGPEVVIAAGGDGTVSMVAELLDGTDIVLGILPAGSGNGLSKDLGIPQNNFSQALDCLVHGRIKKMDTLRANNHFFMHLADLGFNAHIVKLFNKSESRGLFTYAKHVTREFFNYPTQNFSVKTDNGDFEGNAFMITIANSNQFGSNLMINPEGKWNDGKFEIIIIKKFPKKEAFKLFFRLLTKKIKFSPHCIIIKCTKASITCEKKKTLQFDGELGKKVKNVSIEIKPKNLLVVTP
jgi:YegS/Rv2252/BmrU family lipid kinase